jgi:hypothetical protein
MPETCRQKKTGCPVRFELTEQTRQAIDDYLRMTRRKPGEFLFAGRGGGGHGLTTRQYARLVGSPGDQRPMLERFVDVLNSAFSKRLLKVREHRVRVRAQTMPIRPAFYLDSICRMTSLSRSGVVDGGRNPMYWPSLPTR